MRTERPGFQTGVRDSIELCRTARVDFTTRVGDMTQAMEASAAASAIGYESREPHRRRICTWMSTWMSTIAGHEPDAVAARAGRACIARRAPRAANGKWTSPGRFHAQAVAWRSGQVALDKAIATHFRFCFLGGFICER
jgi:hypothetical protein